MGDNAVCGAWSTSAIFMFIFVYICYVCAHVCLYHATLLHGAHKSQQGMSRQGLRACHAMHIRECHAMHIRECQTMQIREMSHHAHQGMSQQATSASRFGTAHQLAAVAACIYVLPSNLQSQILWQLGAREWLWGLSVSACQ